MGIIYRAHNIINGKSYIGKTIHSLSNRISTHYSSSKTKNFHFSKALRKYQKCDWEWSVLCEAKDEDLDELEIFYIAKFDSYNNGYNSTIGGGGGVTVPEFKASLYSIRTGLCEGTYRQLSESTGLTIGAIRMFFTPKQSTRKVLHYEFVRGEDKDNYKDLVAYRELIHNSGATFSGTRLQFEKLIGYQGGYSSKLFHKGTEYKGWRINYDI